MKKKEHALKLALSVSNAAKEEIEELKQKCNNSSRAADAMANKCQDAKVEVRLQKKMYLLLPLYSSLMSVLLQCLSICIG